MEQDLRERKHYSGIKLLSIVAGGLFLLLVATMLVPSVLNVDYMFTMGSVLIVLPVASLLMGKMWAKGLTAERLPVDPVVEGESRQVRIVIRQRFPTNLLVEAEDVLPDGVTSFPGMPVTLHLQGSGSEFLYDLRPAKRGVYKLGPTKLRVFDPLGVIGLLRRFGQESEVVVYPCPLPIDSWTLVAGSGPAGPIGEALAKPAVGASSEFYGTRRYYPGDDFRRIHWKSVARARQLVVKEFLDDLEVDDALVIIDTKVGTDVSQGNQSSLDYAVRAAAYVSERILSMNGGVSIATAATPGRTLATAGTLHDLPVLLDCLARTRADSTLSLAQVLQNLDSYVQRSTALVIVSSVVDDASRAEVSRLLARGASVAQVYVDPASFQPAGETRQQTAREYLLDPRIPCWRIVCGEAP